MLSIVCKDVCLKYQMIINKLITNQAQQVMHCYIMIVLML